jgi:acyl-CoA thioesterase
VDDHLVRRDAFAKYIGLELVHVEAGAATVRMAIKPEHLNGLGIVHGGAVFTLADYAFAAACNAAGKPTVAIHASIAFLKAARTGTLTAQANATVHAKIGQYEIRVTDETGTLVAIFHGMSYEKSGTPR